MKELLLRSFLPGQELHVVEDQAVYLSHPILEFCGLVPGDRIDESIGKRLSAQEQHLCRRVALKDRASDRVYEMGFP
jgi:hypothetical protein